MASRTFNTGSGMTTRPSIAPQSSGGAVKARQLVSGPTNAPKTFTQGKLLSLTNASGIKKSHLHSQLEQLSSNLADTENLLRMTAVQAEAMRGLGSWHGGM